MRGAKSGVVQEALRICSTLPLILPSGRVTKRDIRRAERVAARAQVR